MKKKYLKKDGSPMSRQQVHMVKKKARGICWICTNKAIRGRYLCIEHQVKARERMREKLGCVRRYISAESYHLDTKGHY